MASHEPAEPHGPETAGTGRYTIRAVDRALQLLTCFGDGRSGYTLAQLAHASGIGKPTVHRLICTLEERRFIERRSDGTYALGPALVMLGMIASEKRELSQLVAPLVQQVAGRTGEATSCTVLDDHAMVAIASTPGRYRLRYDVYPGERAPVSRTADGRIMLAQLSRDEVLRRVAAEVKESGRTVTKAWLRRLSSDLKEIRESGVASNEFEPGISCIAVPLWNHHRTVVAALLVTVPTVRMREPLISETTKSLLTTASEPVPWSLEGRVDQTLPLRDRSVDSEDGNRGDD